MGEHSEHVGRLRGSGSKGERRGCGVGSAAGGRELAKEDTWTWIISSCTIPSSPSPRTAGQTVPFKWDVLLGLHKLTLGDEIQDMEWQSKGPRARRLKIQGQS